MRDRKVVLFIAESLDGYIARKDENLDWLFAIEGKGDNGYSEFYADVDTILMGRTTYDWLLRQEMEFPYSDKEVFVFSHTKTGKDANVTFIDLDLPVFINSLKNKLGKKIWLVGGGKLIIDFLNEKLIDEMIITIAPVLIGNGIVLFRKSELQTNLKLTEIKRHYQFAELHYQVIH